MLRRKNRYTKLWEIFMMEGHKVRSMGGDGRARWETLKAAYEADFNEFDYSDLNWTEKSGEFYDGLSKILTEDTTDPRWETHHWLLQHGRIVFYNEFSPLRLCQIAYNSGQYIAARDSEHYLPEAKKYYSDNDLGSINTYVEL
jgi:hypothetical protein